MKNRITNVATVCFMKDTLSKKGRGSRERTAASAVKNKMLFSNGIVATVSCSNADGSSQNPSFTDGSILC